VRLHEPDGYECRGPTEVMVLEDPGQPLATSEAGARLDRTYAGVRFGGDFEPITASTSKQREVLLEQVKAHITTEFASRQRKRASGRRTDGTAATRTRRS
jgi:hypothetical protein